LAQPNFQFDHVFDQSKSNEHIYSKVVQHVALDCLDGYNGTIFMYGQTGSGKTHTMLGYNANSNLKRQSMIYPKFSMDLGQRLSNKKEKPFPSLFEEHESVSFHGENSNLSENSDLSGDCPIAKDLGINDINQKCPELIYNYTKSSLSENNGILIQALKDIFQKIDSDAGKRYFLKCSYFEIYNDQIYDLLTSQDKIKNVLTLMQDTKKDTFNIRNLTEKNVTNVADILELLKRGEINRHYASTMMNHTSSRSHT
jgi:hypothetical protein